MLPLIVVFAKAPVAGRVKTRLGVGAARALELHDSFVRQTLRLVDSLRGEADAELSTDESTGAWQEFAMARSVQATGSLGQRMYGALERGLASGRPQVMILGSDSPGLPAGHLRALLSSPADVAMGPTEDGGYYAIACRRVQPEMFDGVRWSTENALADTLAGARRCGFGVELGLRWFDIDRPEDLIRLGDPRRA